MTPRIPGRSEPWLATDRGPGPAPTGFRYVFALALLAIAATSHAQEPQVRTTLAAGDPTWAGQKVTLVVELLVPGYFASAASFAIPDPQGVLLMPPQGSPLVGSETIAGTHFTSQRHELQAWPLRAGEQEIPAFEVRFAWKRSPLDTDSVPAALATQAQQFTVQTPPGAEHLGTVISARELTISEDWQPQPGSAPVTAGSAFTRTVRFSAPGVPGMVFPPFPAAAVDGLGVYPKRALDDRSNRGELVGARLDTITYVAERPGQHTIPAARFTWFDLDAQELRTQDFAAVTLDVVVNPALAAGDAAADGAAGTSNDIREVIAALDWRWLAAGAVVLLVLLAVSLDARVRALVDRGLATLRPVHLRPLHPR